MERLSVPVPFGREEAMLALACARTPEGHTGLAFFDRNGAPVVFHLDGQDRLLYEPAPPARNCWWVQPIFADATMGKHLVAYIRSAVENLSRRRRPIDYGPEFLKSKGSFDAQGQYTPPPDSTGLTCASFVLELLRAGGVILIREETWRATERNGKWAAGLEAFFRRLESEARHEGREGEAELYASRAKAFRDAGGLRLLPVEVAGAVTLGDEAWPVSFDQAQQAAEGPRQALAAVCPP